MSLLSDESRIQRLEEQVREHDQRINEGIHIEEGFEKRIKELETKVELHNTLLGNLTVGISNLGDRFAELEAQVNKLQVSETHILARLHQLEEKERARARDEHERDVSE